MEYFVTWYITAWEAITVLNIATEQQDVFLLLQKLRIKLDKPLTLSLEVWLVLHNQIEGRLW